jgi:hypothetical protein
MVTGLRMTVSACAAHKHVTLDKNRQPQVADRRFAVADSPWRADGYPTQGDGVCVDRFKFNVTLDINRREECLADSV